MTDVQTKSRPAIAKFRAPTALAVPGLQIFPSDIAIVTVTNWTERDEAGERHRGLVVDVALDAADPDDAVRRGLGPASRILSLLTFASAAAAGSLRPFVAYAERSDDGCDVAQFDEWPLEPNARRMLKKERVKALIARSNGLSERERGRVARGLDWYRQALTETNVFDRFSATWIGLESINPLLRERRGLPTTRLIACKSCGALNEAPDNISGLIDLVTRRFGEDEATHVRRFRQQFMHSTRPLHELVDDARRATKTAVDALRLGLLELFNSSPDEVELLRATPMRLPERNQVRYGYRMRPLRIATVPPGQACPRIGLRRFTAERALAESARTKEHIVHELELLDFKGDVPSPFQLDVAIPSADPDERDRKFELSSFEFISKETGEVIERATVTPRPEGSSDPEAADASPRGPRAEPAAPGVSSGAASTLPRGRTGTSGSASASSENHLWVAWP